MDLGKLDEAEFNRMPLPRPFILKKSAVRSFWYIWAGIFVLMLLCTLIGFGVVVKKDLDNLKFKKNGIKVAGTIEKIERITGRSGSRNYVTYSYKYANVDYRGVGPELYGEHKPADIITVYISPADPNDSRAEFTIGEESQVYARLRKNSKVLFLPPGIAVLLCLLFLPAWRHDRAVDKNIFANGRMTSAKVLQVFRGRGSYVEVEFSANDGNAISTKVPYSSALKTRVQPNDVIKIVYLPNDVKAARIFPPLAFDFADRA